MSGPRLVIAAVFFACISTFQPLYAGFQEGARAASRGDFKTARNEWYGAAEEGNVDAQFNLGALLLSDKLGQPDIPNGVMWLGRAADAGHGEATFALAMLYYSGLGEVVEKDVKRAFGMFMRLAKTNNAAAQFSVGTMLMKGVGVAKNYEDAARWFRKAAARGHAKAQYNLGLLVAKGAGTKQDPALARHWFAQSAELGFAPAQHRLGMVLLGDNMNDPDHESARTWLMRAADAGNVPAAYTLGFVHYHGIGGVKNYDKARERFEQAAAGWDRNGQFYLGKMYLNGDGVDVELLESYKWFDLAASAGHEDAHLFRALVAARISNEQRRAAHDRAQKWFDANHDTPHSHQDTKPHAH